MPPSPVWPVLFSETPCKLASPSSRPDGSDSQSGVRPGRPHKGAAVPSTSEVACQTAVTVSGHYEDPKLKLADLKSPRPTSNFLRRKATKLLKQLEDSLNESFELSLDHSRTELELEEVENEVKLIEEYEIGPEDLEEEEDNEDQENKEE
ncbi:hypothetical protein L596_017818 [Steinernema carpocapsae]|uniref:Uncharacterized protein n=1 Tax=Steinernema carpocapsae TaxID=34508 RepID=A0A4U5N3H1_STECR|nr:hypothetical protein L596_017818 [Steinernema carpocapsae]